LRGGIFFRDRFRNICHFILLITKLVSSEGNVFVFIPHFLHYSTYAKK